MKSLLLLCLTAAGTTLGYVAMRAPDRTYEPPVPVAVPVVLTEDPPSDCRVVQIEVDGMCCDGCAAKLHGVLTSVDLVREAAVDFVLGRAEVTMVSHHHWFHSTEVASKKCPHQRKHVSPNDPSARQILQAIQFTVQKDDT